MRIGFDLDGVGFDFHVSLYTYLTDSGHNDKYNMDLSNVNRWEFYLDWGMTVQEFIQHCHDGVDAGYVFRGDVKPGFVQAVHRVKALEHTVHIVTDRAFGTNHGSRRATREWLEEHNIPYDSLDFSPDKRIAKADMFVEDKLENYDMLEDAGVDVYLINRPWNTYGVDNRQRINDISEFADAVEAKTILERV